MLKKNSFKKGHIPWNKNLKYSDLLKSKLKMEGLKLGRGLNKGKKRPEIEGKKNWNWKGGDTRWFHKQVLIRDDYTCQICGYREIEIMEVDHIKPKSIYPELQFEMNNMVTLCPNCHRRKTNREKKQIANMKKQANSGEIPTEISG